MSEDMTTVLVVGATGSIGRLVVAEALRAGYETRALVRSAASAESFPPGTRVVVGDLTTVDGVRDAVAGVTGVVFTHGSHGGAHEAETVDYGAVRNVLHAVESPVRIALMSTVGVTKRTPGHDWKRRGERLVRASGLPYTVVRPGWFDYNGPAENRLVMVQGDTRWAGDPTDGVVARAAIAHVLLASLTSDSAKGKTLELVAETGPMQSDLDPIFAALTADPKDAVDAVLDRDTMPLADEPRTVRRELDAIGSRFDDDSHES